eukprot:9414901-Pyramimonas_sp.AAC.1
MGLVWGGKDPQGLGDDISRRNLPQISGVARHLETHLFREGFSPHKLTGQLVIPNPSQTCLPGAPGRCRDNFDAQGLASKSW